MTSAVSKKNFCLFLAAMLCVAAMAAGGLFLLLPFSAGGVVPQERYYRAVYVLQSFGGPACDELEEIPGRVTYADDTENLLHHPDRILVLRYVADELAKLRREMPKARYYEACARLALGERQDAVDLLTAYVIDNEYNAAHYAVLCEALYELGDYTSLLLMCKEWQERDPSCREDRIRYAWAAQFNLGRYAQARRIMRQEGECLGWRATVYDAKTALAMNGEAEARQILEVAMDRYTDNVMQIIRLWNILKAKHRV